MKKESVVLICILFIKVCFSQSKKADFEQLISSEIKDVFHETSFIDVYKDKSGKVGALRYFNQFVPRNSKNRVRGIIIQKWNDKGEIIFDKKHLLNVDEKSFTDEIFIKESKFYALECSKNKSENRLDYFVHVYDEEKKLGKKKLFSVEVEDLSRKLKYYKDYRYDNDYRGSFYLSGNKEFLAFSIDLERGKNNEERHQIILLDKNFDVVWNREFTNDTKDSLFYYYDLNVSNSGDVFISAKVYNEVVKEKRKGNVNYKFELFKLTKNESKKLTIDASNYFTSELHVFPEGDKIKCMGVFSEELYRIDGTIYYQIENDSFSLVDTNKQKLKNSALIEKYGNLLKKNLPDYKIKEVKKIKSGGYVLVAENSFMNYNSSSMSYDDVLVIFLSDNGNMFWSRNVNKSLNGGLDGLFSISPIINNNKQIVFFANAHKELGKLPGKGFELNSGKAFVLNKNNSSFYAVVFDKEGGEYSIQTVQNNKEFDRIYNVSKAKSLDAKSLVLWNSKRKKGQFLTVEIK